MAKEIIAEEARFGRVSRVLRTTVEHSKLTVWVEDATNPANLLLGQADNSNVGPHTNNYKSRGTVDAPANVVADDNVSGWVGFAYSGGTWFDVGSMVHVVDGAFVSGQRPPSRWEWAANIANAAPAAKMKLLSTGTLFLGDVAGAPDTGRVLHLLKSTAGLSPFRIENTTGGATANCVSLSGGSNATPGSDFIGFFRPDGTVLGRVRQDAAGTIAYQVVSDARLKQNIADLPEEGLQIISALRPRRFSYRSDASHRMNRGFIAQEVFNVLPEAVTISGEDCECDLSDDKPHVETCCFVNPSGLDSSRLVAVMVKAIQELTARVVALGG